MAAEENVGKPSSGSQPGPGQERRAAPRHPSSVKILCYPVGAGLGERRQVRVRNASRTGIAVLTDRRWDPGTSLVLELPGEEGPQVLRGRVVHATPQPGGCFLTGCVLDFPLSDAQLQALIS